MSTPWCDGAAGYQGGPHPRHEFCATCRAISQPPTISDFWICCRCLNLNRYEPKPMSRYRFNRKRANCSKLGISLQRKRANPNSMRITG